jgi:hypothetical protein
MKQSSKSQEAKKTQSRAPEVESASASAKLLIFSACIALGIAFMTKAFLIPAITSNGSISGARKLAATIPDHDRYNLRHYNIIGEVPVITWEPSKPFAKEIIAGNRPVVLRNTFVANWPALKKWNPAVLSQRSGPDVFQFKTIKDNNVYLYSQPKPLNKLSELGFQEPNGVSSRTMKQFWSHASTMDNFTNSADPASRLGQNWLYYTGILIRSNDDKQEFPALLAELPNLKSFVVNEDFYAIHLWLGSRGLTAQTHYDEAPNFATQVYGHKRWILSPPRYETFLSCVYWGYLYISLTFWLISEASKFYSYPFSHPFRSQSQVDFATTSASSIDYRSRRASSSTEALPADFALFGNITAYEVLLGPGDVLYIPPMWYHRVVTEDVSIMINAWTDPPEGDPHERLIHLPIPIEEDWTLEQKAAGLLWFFRSISDKLPVMSFSDDSGDSEWAFLCVKT